MTMAGESKRRKVAAQTGVYLVVVLVIAIVANVFAAYTPARIDLTEAQRYTLSGGSERLVRSLKTPIQVDAYVTYGVPFVNAFVDDLTNLLGEYEAGGDGKFEYTLIEANTEDLRKQAKEAGLQQFAFQQSEGEGSTVTPGYLGLIIKYGNEQVPIPLQPQQAAGLEFFISSKIRELRSTVDDVTFKIGVVSGKGELKLSDPNLVRRDPQRPGPTLDQVVKANFPFYQFEDVDLSGPIDSELHGLLITQPAAPYTDEELHRIDDFVMLGGKSLAVFAGAANLKPNDASMVANLDMHHLDTLLKGYGIDVQSNVVIDRQRGLRMTMFSALGPVELAHPGVTLLADDPRYDDDEALLDTDFAPFFRLSQISVPFASSIELIPSAQPEDVDLRAVARTTEGAIALEGPTADLGLKRDWNSIRGEDRQYAVAATAEGRLRSAFASEGDDKRAPEVSRVLVIASGQFITNPFAIAGNGPDLGPQFAKFGAIGGDPDLLMVADAYTQLLEGMVVTLVNTLDWMSGDPELLAATAKFFGDPDVVYPAELPKLEEGDTPEIARRKNEAYLGAKQQTKQAVQWTLTLVIPVFFAVLGLLRWRRRESLRTKSA